MCFYKYLQQFNSLFFDKWLIEMGFEFAKQISMCRFWLVVLWPDRHSNDEQVQLRQVGMQVIFPMGPPTDGVENEKY